MRDFKAYPLGRNAVKTGRKCVFQCKRKEKNGALLSLVLRSGLYRQLKDRWTKVMDGASIEPLARWHDGKWHEIEAQDRQVLIVWCNHLFDPQEWEREACAEAGFTDPPLLVPTREKVVKRLHSALQRIGIEVELTPDQQHMHIPQESLSGLAAILEALPADGGGSAGDLNE